MKSILRVALPVALAVAFSAQVRAEPPPRLSNADEVPAERAPVRLPGTVRSAAGNDGVRGTQAQADLQRSLQRAVDRMVARQTQPGPTDLGGSEFRSRGPLSSGGAGAVHGSRQIAFREIRRVIRQLD